MSGTARPVPVSGIPKVAMAQQGAYATQGMLSPANPFTQDGMLTPVSFRFLWGLFNTIQAQQAQITTLQQRLAAANIA